MVQCILSLSLMHMEWSYINYLYMYQRIILRYNKLLSMFKTTSNHLVVYVTTCTYKNIVQCEVPLKPTSKTSKLK